jgi:hypothetical protein
VASNSAIEGDTCSPSENPVPAIPASFNVASNSAIEGDTCSPSENIDRHTYLDTHCSSVNGIDNCNSEGLPFIANDEDVDGQRSGDLWVEDELETPTSDFENDADSRLPPDEELLLSLAMWKTQFCISGNALRALLAILKPWIEFLPLSPKTLMKTGKVEGVKEIPGGQYYHFGIANQLATLVERDPSLSQSSTLYVQINVDGIPLFKSTNGTFWPILGKLLHTLSKSTCEPFVIGLFFGKAKPCKPFCVDAYLHEFISEVKNLKSNGLQLNGVVHAIELPSFVCDAPARQFLKCIKPHTGYSSCEKCTCFGENLSNRMCFPDLDASLRTDETFNLQLDEEHHQGVSPLTQINAGLVSQVPLDYMHLVCLGIQKRLIKLWRSCPKKLSRIHPREFDRMSEMHVDLRHHKPKEFAREPRSMYEFLRWKATEFRMYLLYTGVLVLRTVSEVHYHNFLLLSCGIRILASPALCRSHNAVAKTLLRNFVEHYTSLFGRSMVVYNVHSLIHLSDDVMVHGPLDDFSAFPFENFLQQVKKTVQKANQPLVQAVLRLQERTALAAATPTNPIFEFRQEHFLEPYPDNSFHNVVLYQQAIFPSFTLSLKESDRCFKVGDDVAMAHNFVRCDEGSYVMYSTFQNREDFFSYPLHSGALGIWLVSDLREEIEITEVCNVDSKYVKLPVGGQFLVLPLLHTS